MQERIRIIAPVLSHRVTHEQENINMHAIFLLTIMALIEFARDIALTGLFRR